MTNSSPDGIASERGNRVSKVETLVALLREPAGASIAELASATGWQNHSVQGALAGTLKKKGHCVRSDVVDGLRRYRITETAA